MEPPFTNFIIKLTSKAECKESIISWLEAMTAQDGRRGTSGCVGHIGPITMVHEAILKHGF